MKETSLRAGLARVMVGGLFAAAAVMLVGTIVFLSRHGSQPPGDHRFTGEPADLTHPVAIARAAWQGNDDSLMQVGVLLLLLNPLVRVALAAVGYAAGGDRLYAAVGAGVLGVLVVSYFV